jgi:hypothetical protein
MSRRLLPLVVVVSLGAILASAAGCNRGGGQGPAFPQPIRDEKEPGESVDYVSAVPDTGSSSGVEETSGGTSENELEIDEDGADGDSADGKEVEKSAYKSDDNSDDKSDDEGGGVDSGDDDGGEDETGDEPGDLGLEP